MELVHDEMEHWNDEWTPDVVAGRRAGVFDRSRAQRQRAAQVPSSRLTGDDHT
jgi:hypothetical protein